MKKITKTILIVIALVIVVGAVVSYVVPGVSDVAKSPAEEAEISGAIQYENQEFGFEAALPPGFKVKEMEDGDSRILTFENDRGEGIQVIISRYDDVMVLTEEMIRRDIPDMAISDVQPVEIGRDGRGLAFVSDNPSFDGKSREVWFVYRSNLYQISTFARLDSILKSIFSTWKFR